jgi:hypothetical protein
MGWEDGHEGRGGLCGLVGGHWSTARLAAGAAGTLQATPGAAVERGTEEARRPAARSCCCQRAAAQDSSSAAAAAEPCTTTSDWAVHQTVGATSFWAHASIDGGSTAATGVQAADVPQRGQWQQSRQAVTCTAAGHGCTAARTPGWHALPSTSQSG